MLSLIVLFTIFLGLVGVLALYGRCQRRGHRQDTRANLLQLNAWLEEKGHHVPSAAVVIGLLNRVTKKQLQSESWQELSLSGLLPHTQLPHFLVHKIQQQTAHYIEFKVGVEWPMCLPGLGVSLVREGGEEVTCEMQVDWMYAEAIIRLTDSIDGLLLSFKHTLTPQMALSCLVTTEGVTQSEELASSVAHSLQLMFYQLELTNETLCTETADSSDPPHSNLPEDGVPSTTPSLSLDHNHTTPDSGHYDNHHHGNETQTPSQRSSLDSMTSPLSVFHSTSQLGGEEVVVEDDKVEEGGEEGDVGVVTHVHNGVDPVPSPVSSKLWEREGVGVSGENGDGEEDENGGEERGEDSSAGDVKEKPIHEENGVEAVPPDLSTTAPMLVITSSSKAPPTVTSYSNPSSPLTTNNHVAQNFPFQHSRLSSSWRRTPSYERLQEFMLPAVQEGGVVTGEPDSDEARLDTFRRPAHSMVAVRRGSETGEEGLSPERQRRQSLSMSGSAYSIESREEMYPSTLVFEIKDSERTRHVAVLSQAHASKLRKRISHARKLHIYNNHIFVATHLRQRFYCHVCKKKIAGFMGKQGYACRDCNMVVHKHCHYKVEGLCTNSKLSSMNLIYPDSVSTISRM